MSNKPLTWNDLADIYDAKHGGRKARTLPMDTVWDWAAKQPYLAVRDECIFLLPEVKP